METKITTVSLATKEDKYYADKTLYQWNYGQILRIIDADLPMAVEIGFSTTEKSGDSDVRVGSTNNGVTTVAIPNKLFEEERSTDYSIYAFVYVTDENSGTTVHEIVIPVKARAKQGDPSEDPSIDPSIFKDAVNAVNASAERAETAEKSAKESADKAKEYADSAGKSKEDVEKARNNAISAIGTEKESALRGIQSQTEESQNSIKQSIADATEKKTELDGAIRNATDAKGNLDKAVQSAGNAKAELESSIGKAGEAKTSLDSSIRSAGEKQLALDTTVERANAVDASLKEHIGSAEQIQANVEQIAKNKADISSLNEDLADLKDKKITKFYASNQGETHLADSDNGKIQDMIIYGRSSQFTTTGKNLLKYPYVEATKTSLGVTFMDNKDGSINVSGIGTGVAYYDLYSNRDGKRLTLASGTYKLVVKGRSKCNVSVNNGVNSAKNEGTFTITDGHNDVWCYIEAPKGLALDETIYPMIQLASITDESYEPYTGGKPSPNPDYPQEIKRVVKPVVKGCGKNLYNARAYPLIGNGYNGLTVQKKDDYYTIVGTATAETVLWLCGSYNNRTPLFTLKKGNYALTSSLTIYSSTGDVRKKVTGIFSIDEDYPVTGVCAAYQKGDVLNNKLYVQIEKGSEATSYEPYIEQSVQLPYTLNAIPVASGGNVTIDGQQWVCDEVDLERGVKVQRTKVKELSPDDEWAYRKLASGNNNFQVRILNADVAIDGKPCFCNILPFKNVIWDDSIQNLPKIYANKQEITVSFPPSSEYSSLEAFKHMLTDVKSVIYYILATPIETPLTQEEASAFKQLMTYYPVTNISVTSDQLDGYTVFNYPISMANGWNYVKKQLGDTRDYIYDMDIQSAEAYVNSEYAVVLTELEV